MQQWGKWQFMMDNIQPVMRTLASNLDKQSNYPRYTTQVGGAKLVEREMQLENMGNMSIWPNAAYPAQGDFGPGWPQSYTQMGWALSFAVTKQQERFDQQGFVAAASAGLVEAGPYTTEFLMSLYLDNAASTTAPEINGTPIINVKGGDQLALASTSHPYRQSSTATWANRSTTTGDPSEATFTAAYSQLERQVDNQGRPLGYDFMSVEVPPELWTKAKVALESRLQPTTANNAENQSPMTMKGGMQINENKYLSSTTNWFLFTNAKDGKVKLFWGWKPEFSKLPRDRAAVAWMINDMSLAHGFNSARAIWLVG